MSAPLLEMPEVSRRYRRGGGIFGGNCFAAVDDVSFPMPEAPALSSIVGEYGSRKIPPWRRCSCGCWNPATAASRFWAARSTADGPSGVPEPEFRRLVQPIFQNPFEAFSANLRLSIICAARR